MIRDPFDSVRYILEGQGFRSGSDSLTSHQRSPRRWTFTVLARSISTGLISCYKVTLVPLHTVLKPVDQQLFQVAGRRTAEVDNSVREQASAGHLVMPL